MDVSKKCVNVKATHGVRILINNLIERVKRVFLWVVNGSKKGTKSFASFYVGYALYKNYTLFQA